MWRKALCLFTLAGLLAGLGSLASATMIERIHPVRAQLATGEITLTTNPATAVIAYSQMAPGAKVTTPLTVTNAGTLNLRYALTANLNGDQTIISGYFTQAGGQAHGGLARVKVDGSVEASFTPSTDSEAYALALQSDDRIVIGGYFAQVNGVARNNLARLNADGSLDPAFNPSANSTVNALAVQSDGKLLLGGYFSQVNGTPRNYLARLAADGSLDTGFNLNANNSVDCLAVQANGKILVGGMFTQLAGQTRNRLARLNADGTLDTGFNPNVTGNGVSALATHSNGQIVIGGYFSQVGGQTRSNIARLNADGTLDTAFTASTDNQVRAVAVQSDGKVLLGGSFYRINGQLHVWFGRVNADGTFDAAFNSNANVNNFVLALGLPSDGKLLLGGMFTLVDGQTRYSVARLNADGTLDTGFNLNLDNPSDVRAIAVKPGAQFNVNALTAQLQLAIKSGVTTCTNGGFAATGTVLYSGPLTTAHFGDPTQGPQTGDRPLAIATGETLCFQATLPLTTTNAYQNMTTTATFTLSAEQTLNNP